jgi:hypothetical protein
MNKVFNDDNYTYDADMNKRYGLTKFDEVCCLSFDEYASHFNSLRVIKEFINKIIFLKNVKYNNYEVLSDLIKSIPSNIALATTNWLIFKDYQGIIKSHKFLNKEVTVLDTIDTCNKLGGKTQFQEIESFDLGGLN